MRGTLQGNRMSAKPNKPPQPPDIGSRPRTGYIWMAYSVFFFIEPLVRHQRRFLAVCCAFFTVFVSSFTPRQRAKTIRPLSMILASLYPLRPPCTPTTPCPPTFYLLTPSI